MDNRFTKKRVTNMLSYDWGKMLILIVAICLVWALAFTVGAPRASTGQVFTFIVNGSELYYANSTAKVLDDAYKKGVFSYDVLDFSSRDLEKSTAGQILSAMTSVAEGDVIIHADTPEAIKNKNSSFRSFIDGYGNTVYGFDELIERAEEYALLHGVYEKDGKYFIDEKIAEEYFALRMKKDPRFRKENSDRYKECAKKEVERIKNVWNNAVLLKDCLDKHPELRLNYTQYEQALLLKPDDEEIKELFSYQTEKTYGINLGKLTGGKEKIIDAYYYVVSNENKDNPDVSSDGVILSVFNFSTKQPDLQYETLSFVNYFVSRFSNFLNLEHENLIA